MIASACIALLCACSGVVNEDKSNISEKTILEAAAGLDDCQDPALAQKGIRQAASLWRESDGNEEAFKAFVQENFAAGPEAKQVLFEKLEKALEIFNGSFNHMTIELQKPTVLAGPDPTEIDYILGSYSPYAHFSDDMYANKVAFITALNFPFYTLAEKNSLGPQWSRLEWAYARMGDIFTARVPASVQQKANEAYAATENYIASYNIMMGHLLTEDGRRLFPEDMCLLSHWNLRDEIKSNYADIPDALEKQEMIYEVMKRIVAQEIPEAVINDPSYDWAPYSNKTWKDGKEIELERENDTRYEKILGVFRASLEEDAFRPDMPDAIKRHFEGSLEIPAQKIEEMFIELISSPKVKEAAAIIKERLGRDLRPYDIWYDGFKSRSAIPEDYLTGITRSRYPDAEAFKKDCPRILQQMGFSPEESRFIADRVEVQGARGSGHAWQCESRNQPALLRTRIGGDGMDYKGYNIAVHEFGHNVEMVLDLYHIDHYMLHGVPTEAFTEAMAFLFQNRDLQLLGLPEQPRDKNAAINSFWEMYEIMGVSLVDMYMWRWLYQNKEADAAQLREAVLRIAKEVWNKYYEPVLGEHDSPILGIYSHMVNAPMYLPSYPIGHIIHYQIEEHLAGCQSRSEFADELTRIYTLGCLTPEEWMRRAVSSDLSTSSCINAW